MSIVKMYFYFYFYCPFLFPFVRVRLYNIFKISSAIFPIFFEKNMCIFRKYKLEYLFSILLFPHYFFDASSPTRARIYFIKNVTPYRDLTRGLITKVFKQINRLCFFHLFLSLSLLLARVATPCYVR